MLWHTAHSVCRAIRLREAVTARPSQVLRRIAWFGSAGWGAGMGASSMADNFGCMMLSTSRPKQAPPLGLAVPWLHAEVARRMAERLSWVTVPVEHWAAWGLAQGGGLAELQAQYPGARGTAIERTGRQAEALRQHIAGRGWLQRLGRRWSSPKVQVFQHPRAEPAPGSAVQLVWANLVLDSWGGVAVGQAEDIAAELKAWHDSLAVGGFVMFTCFGPDTAKELRAVHAEHGWGSATQAYTDMHDWGDRLVSAGFADPVMDMEKLTLTYADTLSLERELRSLGRNRSPDRFVGLRTPRWREAWREAIRGTAHPADGAEPGRIVLTVELVYGHAFKVAPRLPVAAETRFSVGDLRASLAAQPSKNPRRSG